MIQLFFFAMLSLTTAVVASQAPQFWNRPVVHLQANLEVQMQIDAVLENLTISVDFITPICLSKFSHSLKSISDNLFAIITGLVGLAKLLKEVYWLID